MGVSAIILYMHYALEFNVHAMNVHAKNVHAKNGNYRLCSLFIVVKVNVTVPATGHQSVALRAPTFDVLISRVWQ